MFIYPLLLNKLQVYKRKMFGPDYAWVWIGKPETIWWRNDTTSNFNSFQFSSLTKSARSFTQTGNAQVSHATQEHKQNNIDNNYYSFTEVDDNEKQTLPYQLGNLRTKKGGQTDQNEPTKLSNKQLSVKLDSGCSQKELTLAIENALVVDRFNVLEGDQLSDFGLVSIWFFTFHDLILL